MPVLPLEGSSRVAPGASRPAFSASSTICLAMRSLTLPVGFWLSSLAHRRTPGFGDSRGRPTSGVLPIASARSSWRMGLPAFGHPARGTACHRRKDGDHVAVVELGIERAEEADVLVIDVDVHEAVLPSASTLLAPSEYFRRMVGIRTSTAIGAIEPPGGSRRRRLDPLASIGSERAVALGAGDQPVPTSSVAAGGSLAVPHGRGESRGRADRSRIAPVPVEPAHADHPPTGSGLGATRTSTSLTCPSRMLKPRRLGAFRSASERIR